MFLVEQSVVNSLLQSKKTAYITPVIASNEDYEDIYIDEVKKFNITNWLRQSTDEFDDDL